MIKICFVTSELMPFSTGGIGVLIHNLLRQYKDPEVEFNVLAAGDWSVDHSVFEQVFPGVKLWRVGDLLPKQPHLAINPPEWAFTTHGWHFKSYQSAQALLQLEAQGVVFDVVEFPDWGGLAFCSCQEKLLGHFATTLLSVRLHSTDSILRSGQPVAGSAIAANLSDLERKSLRDADIVVAHLAGVAEATCTHFGFDGDWLKKVKVDAPPVGAKALSASTRFDKDTPICFSSKIQALKRPEVFLNGALGFIRNNPDYKGIATFIAYPSDDALNEYLSTRVPEAYTDRVSFLTNAPQPLRASIIQKSISVFPSPFESFCLAAYEASLQGSLVVLNGNNPAFSEGTVWRDGVNCLKFDGTSLGLAERLTLAWKERRNAQLSPVDHEPAEIPYWKSTRRRRNARRVASAVPAGRALVSIVVPYFNMGRYIYRTLESALASSYPNIEVVVVDDCSTDAHSRMVLEKIRAAEQFDCVKVVSCPTNVGLSATRNLGIRVARGEFILTLDSDDLIRDDFIEVAVNALERNPDYALVVPQTAFVSDAASAAEMTVVDYALFVGESVRGGAFANRFSTATSLGRKCVYEKFPYDESLSSYEDWDFYSRASRAGCRFIVTSDIFFYYRRRAGSMIAGNTLEKHNRNISILRAKQRAELGNAAIDMNVLTDAEAAYREKLDAMAAASPPAEAAHRAMDEYVKRLRSTIAHKETLLKEARERSAVISEVAAMLRSNERSRNSVEPSVRHRTWKPLSLLGRAFQKARLKAPIRALLERGEFDPQWYLDNNPDVAAEGMDPAVHFILYGQREGRLPNDRGES